MADYDDPRPSSQPVGSTDQAVLKDNLITHDRVVNAESGADITNRFGVTLTPLVDVVDGASSLVSEAILNAGWQLLGEFAIGIEITEVNQVLSYNGILYRTEAALPYTTDGADPSSDSADWYAVIAETSEDETLKSTVAISFNVTESQVLLSSETGISLDSTVLIHNEDDEVTYRKPVIIGSGEVLIGVSSNQITSTSGTYTMVKAETSPLTALSTGQSNMVGSSNVLEGDQSTNDIVYAWNSRFTGVGTGYQLAELGEIPFNGGGQQHIGFNAAKHIASTKGVPVNLINMAQGGISIDKWLSDSADPEMWDAIEANCSASYAFNGEKISVVFWHQGEANVSSDLFYYIDSFLQFRQQVMDAEWSSDDVKFIIGGLALGSPSTGTSGASPSMNLAFSMLAERESNIFTVYTGDLISDSTGVHFTDNSIIEIGKRMGEAAFSNKQEVAQPTRYVEASTNLTYQEGEGYFRDFEDMIDFLSCLEFKGGARLNVTLPAGTYEINPTRFNFDGALINFSGELDAGFTQPVKADFTGVEADDLVMLQGKYLTQLNVTSGNSFFVMNGSNSGVWSDMLLTHTTPTLAATFIRNSDPSLSNIGGGAIEFDNVAMHGASGNSCLSVRADEGCYVKLINGTISHCDQGVLANDARAYVKDNVIAYTDAAINATNRSFINAYGLQIESPTGVSYTASIGSYVDARTADDSANNSTATNGIVEV